MAIDYENWSEEYYEEARKVQRNLKALKAKQKCVNQDERQTLANKILKLQSIYYEILGTAGYLKSRGKANETKVA
ncbi:MAG: hypothetical protein Q4D44_08355 [Eubacteriales bacterium]|nr:hypothetical protein [Eubacteriales bacterium]